MRPGSCDDLARDLEGLFRGRRVLVACVGSPLRGDDAAGLEVCEGLASKGIGAVPCEYGLENCTDRILSERADLLVIVDAVVGSSLAPGDVVIVEPSSAVEPRPATTHSVPLKAVLNFIAASGGPREAVIVGIAAGSLELGSGLTPDVARARDCLVEALAMALAPVKSPAQLR
ncbi:MAG: hydrogenase maturation protease [Desulfurococcaceae archaeon]